VAEVRSVERQIEELQARGVAPADRLTYGRWARWKIVLAYGILFAVAMGSIWMIDDHVLKATPPATMPASNPVR
jgi:hypothetical protein